MSKPAQRWTIEVDNDNAADVWIPNDHESVRLLTNVLERAGLRGWGEVADWPTERPEDPRYGHCDTCGALCDASGCTADRTHVAALA
jgi:hypothetical protein